jgi:hypothetical protein
MTDVNSVIEKSKKALELYHNFSEQVNRDSSRYEAELSVFNEHFAEYCKKYGIKKKFKNLDEIHDYLTKRRDKQTVLLNKNTELMTAIVNAGEQKDWSKVSELLGVSSEEDNEENEGTPSFQESPEEVESEDSSTSEESTTQESEDAPTDDGGVNFFTDDSIYNGDSSDTQEEAEEEPEYSDEEETEETEENADPSDIEW